MLSFEQYGVSFGPPNFSAENHGEEVKPLVSIYAEAVVNAANLESFKPGLQDALWKRPAQNDSERLDESGTVHDLVSRFPTSKGIAFEDKLPGYSLVVHKSELFDEMKEWPDVEIGKIGVIAQNGGTARVKFRIQARGEELEWWVQMMNRAATITLTPPKAEPLPDGHPDAQDDDGDEQEEDLLSGASDEPGDEPSGQEPGARTVKRRKKVKPPKVDPFADTDLARDRQPAATH